MHLNDRAPGLLPATLAAFPHSGRLPTDNAFSTAPQEELMHYSTTHESRYTTLCHLCVAPGSGLAGLAALHILFDSDVLRPDCHQLLLMMAPLPRTPLFPALPLVVRHSNPS